jgi:hypothetical protein
MSRIVAWTGHRPDMFQNPISARGVVETIAGELVAREGAVRFLVGGQRGVDTWAAEAALVCNLPYTLVLPLKVAEFTVDWSAPERAVLELVVSKATEVRVIGGEPAAAYTERNRQLATEADLLVAVWTRPSVTWSGTAETIAFARAAGTPVREVVLPIAQMSHLPRGRGI